MVSRFILIIALWVVMLSFWPSFAEAKLVPIAFTGEVTRVSETRNSLEGRINVGDMITGIYVYDSSTPDSDPSLHTGLYEHFLPPCGITLTAGGFVFTTDPTDVQFYVGVANDFFTIVGIHDAFTLRSYKNLPLSNGVEVYSIGLGFWDPSAGVLSSDALPTTAPVLDDWQAAGLAIGGIGRTYTFSAHLTSAVLVPEPATFLVLGVGSLFLLRKHRR
jgi:hypothetical protein